MFWRDTGTNDDDEDVEAREGACSIETAMFGGGVVSRRERRAGGGDFVCGRGRGWASINQRRLGRNCSGRTRPARESERCKVQRGWQLN